MKTTALQIAFVLAALLPRMGLSVRLADSDDVGFEGAEGKTVTNVTAQHRSVIAKTFAKLRNREKRVGHAGFLKVHEGMKGPIVINSAKFPVVVYLERGYFFNPIVLEPGEAGSLFNKHPKMLPFGITAVIGDEPPSKMDSMKSFVKATAPTVAFLAAFLTSGSSFGVSMMVAAMIHLGSKGQDSSKLDSVVPKLNQSDIDAGENAAGYAKKFAKMLVSEDPASISAKLSWQHAGTSYYEITGGPDPEENKTENLVIKKIGWADFQMKKVENIKQCLSDKSETKAPKVAFEIRDCGDPEAIGKWSRSDFKHSRPRFRKIGDDSLRIQWDKRERIWKMLRKNNWNPLDWFGGDVLYENKANTGGVPMLGWQTKKAGSPLPLISMITSSELAKSDELKDPGNAPTDSDQAEAPSLMGAMEEVLEDAPVAASEATEFSEGPQGFEDAPIASPDSRVRLMSQ